MKKVLFVLLAAGMTMTFACKSGNNEEATEQAVIDSAKTAEENEKAAAEAAMQATQDAATTDTSAAPADTAQAPQ